MGICCFFAVFLSLRCPFQGLALRPMLLARPPPAPSVSCRAPPCNPAAPFEKGVDPKTFLRMGNILSMEGQRTRNAGTVVFRVAVYGLRVPRSMGAGRCPFTDTFRRAPALHPATPFEKGVDPKTLSADGQHTFYGRAKNPVCRSRFSLGTDLWTPVAVPSVGVLCSRAWWEASSESPWVFDDASHLHDLKRLSLFRRDKVLARNTDRPSGFAFTPRKKFLGVPRGVFSKTLLGREWDSVPQKESASQSARCAFSGGTKSFHETPTDSPALPLRPEKSF